MISVVRAYSSPPPWRVQKLDVFNPGTGSNYVPVPGWETSPGYANAVAMYGLVVPESAVVNVAGTYTRGSGSGPVGWLVQLTLNGAAIGSSAPGSSGTVSLSPTASGIAVQSGDVIGISVTPGAGPVVAQPVSTFIEVTAA